MSTWEQIVLGILVLLIVIWFFPGTRRAMSNSPKASREDWQGALLPIGGVVVFVIFLIALVR